MNEAYAGADLILDIAASVPVARHLAEVGIAGPHISVFLNPQGTDVVILAEDRDRTLTLDALEVQYYRAAAADPRLAGHLTANTRPVALRPLVSGHHHVDADVFWSRCTRLSPARASNGPRMLIKLPSGSGGTTLQRNGCDASRG